MNPDLSGPFGEIRAASTVVGNAITAGITAAAAFCAFPKGSGYVWLEGRNYSTAVAIRFSINPWIAVLKTTDGLAAAANTTDYSDAAQDADVATDVVLSSMSVATTHQLWVGSHVPFRGIFADVDAANGATTATMAATFYSSTGPTMAALSLTDGTALTGGTLQVDGAITWTIPADWTTGTLRTIANAAVGIPYSGDPLYWVRFTIATAALDSSTTLDALYAMNRSLLGAGLTTGKPGYEQVIKRGLYGVGCLEASTDAGTGNLVVNVATIGAGSKFG